MSQDQKYSDLIDFLTGAIRALRRKNEKGGPKAAGWGEEIVTENDIAQRVVAKLLLSEGGRAVWNLAEDHRRALAWKVAQRLMIDGYRASSRYQKKLADWRSLARSRLAASSELDEELRTITDDVLCELSSNVRQALDMYYVKRRSIPEIASSLGKDEDTVSRDIDTARRLIRSVFHDLIGDDAEIRRRLGVRK